MSKGDRARDESRESRVRNMDFTYGAEGDCWRILDVLKVNLAAAWRMDRRRARVEAGRPVKTLP